MPTVIVIGANGNGVHHWRHLIDHRWDHFLSPFMAHMAAMARIPNRNDTFNPIFGILGERFGVLFGPSEIVCWNGIGIPIPAKFRLGSRSKFG